MDESYGVGESIEWNVVSRPMDLSECPDCYALVESSKLEPHLSWHQVILDAANSYVDPPRYG